MDELLSEKEQIDAMRSWWKDNGTYVVLGVVIGIGSIVGLNQYRSSQVASQVAASTLFENLAAEVSDNDVEPAEAIVASLASDYPDSVYTDQARLAMARLYMDQGRDEDAAAALRALLDSNGDEQMKLVARLRLAKVMLYQGQADGVVSLLENHLESGFGARFQEALGDAYTELGEHEKAEQAYLAALNDPLASQLVDSALLQMKISDLPEVLPEGQTAAPEDVSAPESEEAADAPQEAPEVADDPEPEAAE